jgi:hypothetical protein
MAKKKAPVQVSPQGVGAYAWLQKPDTKFDAEGKYKVTLLVEKGEHEEFVKTLQEHHEQAGGNAGNSPVKDGDKPLGRNATEAKDEFKGKWLVSFKSKFKPKFVDAKKNPLPDEVKIMSGDVVRVAFTEYDFDRGMSLRLAAVQLIDKRSTGADASGAFDEVDGFDASEAASAFDSDSEATSGEDDDNEDF